MWEAIIGMAMQMFGNEVNKADQQAQYDQQSKLGMQQAVYQQQLGKFNQELAMKTWDQTGYAAQVEQMRKAGLNPGLMYKGAGQGGTVLGNQAGNSVAGGMAAPGQKLQAMGMALNAMMQQAQIKNIEANTEKTKVETEKTAGVDTQAATAGVAKTEAETANVIQKTKNEEINEKILQYERQMKNMESVEQQFNSWERIDQMRTETKRVTAELQSAEAKGMIDTQTAEAVIQQIKTNTIEQQLRIEAQKAGLIKTAVDTESVKMGMQKITAEIQKMAADIRAGRNALQLDRQRVINDIIRTDFQTTDPNAIKQWTDIITDAAQTGAQIAIGTKMLLRK